MTPPIVAELHPPRLPADFVATGPADLLAAFALGLLAAALLALAVAPLLLPRPRRDTLEARLARAAALPPDERRLVQLRLLAEAGKPLPPDLRAALYGRTPPDPAVLDALLRHA